MAKYGQYNFNDGVKFESNYENAYTKAVEPSAESISFKEMFFNNGNEQVVPLRSKLSYTHLYYGNYKFTFTGVLNKIEITSKTWNGVDISGNVPTVFAGITANRTGSLVIDFKNNDDSDTYKLTVSVCGKTRDGSAAVSCTGNVTITDLNLDEYLVGHKDNETIELRVSLVETKVE